MPITFVDGRGVLPTHPTKKFKTRPVSGLRGIVLHQSAGGDDPMATARYHVGPNHISDTGNPGICYSFYVRKSGEIWQCWDLDVQTWSQGSSSPVPGTSGNTNFVGICNGGDFDGPDHKGKDGDPPLLQILATLVLVSHLTGAEKSPILPDELFGAVPCPPESLYGHAQFGKANCPGLTFNRVAGSVRHWLEEGGGDANRDLTDREWQQGLVDLGYDLGTYGPNGDGVDGSWGSASKSAFVQFQRDNGLNPDGLRGPLSQAKLIECLEAMGKPDPRTTS